MEEEMNFNVIRQAVNAQIIEMCANAGMITLGELAARLEAVNKDFIVRFDSGATPAQLGSYRGYYDHVAIESSDKSCTVGELLERVNAAIGGTFEGYKGGEFRMTRMTPVWVSEYGWSSGIGLVGVDVSGDVVILKTEQVD